MLWGLSINEEVSSSPQRREVEGGRLVGQEPQLREEAGGPSLAQGGGGVLQARLGPGQSALSSWLPPSLPTGTGKGAHLPWPAAQNRTKAPQLAPAPSWPPP